MRDWLSQWVLLFLAFQYGNAAAVLADDNPFLSAGVKDVGWPTVRGPAYDGHSPEVGIAETWPEEGPPVLWTQELGQGYSGFVAQGERVYTQAQSVAGQFVYCLNADTGDVLWKYRYGWPYEAFSVYPGPRGTPALSGDRVYFTAPDGLVGCLNASTGKLYWSRKIVEGEQGRGGVDFGYSCSPTVIDGMVLLPVGGEGAALLALDAVTGDEIWKAGDASASYASAFPIERAGRPLVVGYLENCLIIADRRTGELVARLDLSHGYDEHSVWPIYREPYLWISSPFRKGSELLEVPAQTNEKLELKKIWSSDVMSNDVMTSVRVGDQIYGFDIVDVQAKTQRPSRGFFRCLDFMTGTERWSQGTGRPRRGNNRDDPEEIGQAGIVAVDGKLLLLNERGELILLRANPERCEILARASVLPGELTWTPPALHRGRVYVRNQSRAVCVYVGEPDKLQSTRPTLSIADLPQTPYHDLAAMILAIEPEYMFDAPTREWLVRWYGDSIAILVGSAVISTLAAGFWPRESRTRVRGILFPVLAIVAGALGTTLLSRWTGEFQFTWPLCLYIAFEQVLIRMRGHRDGNPSPGGWRGRIPLLILMMMCLAYFWLCRRLGLVFEWSFLMGFPGALPAYVLHRHPTIRPWMSPAVSLVGFTGFYLCGALPLLLKY